MDGDEILQQFQKVEGYIPSRTVEPLPVDNSGQNILAKFATIEGRSQWSDPNIPVQNRVQDFLRTHVAATPTEGGPDTQHVFGVPYQYNAAQEQAKEEEVAAKAKKLFPEVSEEDIRKHFRLQRATARQAKEGESTLEFLARESMPGGSAIGGWARTKRYGEAIKKFDEGKADQSDIEVIARYERLKDIENKETTGQSIVRGLANVPAIAGEGFLGGAVVGRLPLAASTGSGIGTRLGLGVARTGVQTGIMPSMYLKQGAENQVANPTESTFQSYAPAYGLGFVQTAVLGQLSNRFSNVPTKAGRLGARTGLGLAEQQGVDVGLSWADEKVKQVTDKTLGLDTKYGLAGSILRGDDDALKHVTVQTITFAAFATMHGNDPAAKKIQETYKDALDHNANHHEMIHSAQVLQGYLDKNPNLTRAQARQALDYIPEGPVRDYAMSLADALPDKPVVQSESAKPESVPAQAPAEPAVQQPVVQSPTAKPESVLPSGIAEEASLYRGSKPDVNPRTMEGTVGEGLFYSPRPEIAKAYSKSPEGDFGTVVRDKLKFKNLLVSDHWTHAKEQLGLPRATQMKDLIAAAKKAGYDGMKFKVAHGTEYIALPGHESEPHPESVPNPIDSLSEDVIRQHAKFWMMNSQGKIENVLKRIEKSLAAQKSLEAKAKSSMSENPTANVIRDHAQNSAYASTPGHPPGPIGPVEGPTRPFLMKEAPEDSLGGNRPAEAISEPAKRKLGLKEMKELSKNKGKPPLPAEGISVGVLELLKRKPERADFFRPEPEKPVLLEGQDLTSSPEQRDAEAAKVAGLTSREEHVLRERLMPEARSHNRIRLDVEMIRENGKPYSRQRVEQIEAKAREKIAAAGVEFMGFKGEASVAKEKHEPQAAVGKEAAKGKSKLTERLKDNPAEVARKVNKKLGEHDEVAFDLQTKLDNIAKLIMQEGEDAQRQNRSVNRERLAELDRRSVAASEAAQAKLQPRPSKPKAKVTSAEKPRASLGRNKGQPAESTTETSASSKDRIGLKDKPITENIDAGQPESRNGANAGEEVAPAKADANGADRGADEVRAAAPRPTAEVAESRPLIGKIKKALQQSKKDPFAVSHADARELGKHLDAMPKDEARSMAEEVLGRSLERGEKPGNAVMDEIVGVRRVVESQETHWHKIDEPSKYDVLGHGEKVMPVAEQRTHAFAFGTALTPESHPAPPPDSSNLRGGISPRGPGEFNPGNLNNASPQEFALAKAKVAEERAQRDLGPVAAAMRKSNPEAWLEANKRLVDDPDAAAKLVVDLETHIRPTSQVENALLLQRRVALSNSYDKAVSDFNAMNGRQIFRNGQMEPQHSVAELEPLKRRMTDLLNQQEQLDQTTHRAGRELGAGLQFFRQLALADYSLGRMLANAQKAKGKTPLTPEEIDKIKDLQKRLQEAEEKLAKAQSGEKPAVKIGANGDLTDLQVEAKKPKKEYDAVLAAFNRANRPLTTKIFSQAGEVANVSRTFITAYDLSAALRQGAILTFSHPIKAGKNFVESIRHLMDSHYYEREMEKLTHRPNAENGLYTDGKVYFADMNGTPNQQEEAFLGRWIGKIPGVAASARAYSGFLNLMRADVFDSMAASMTRNGKPTVKEALAIGNYVNKATGRGTLPGKLDDGAGTLAHLFFSPRYLASRFQLLTGQPLHGGTWGTRKLIAQEYGRALAGLGAFYGLMAALNDDAKISFDPRSADFGKIRLGQTRIDPLAGFAQVTVFGSRLVSGTTKSTAEGERVSALRGQQVEYGGQTEGDIILRFLRSKLAPVSGTVADVLEGKTIIGEPLNQQKAVTHAAGQLLVPISIRDVYDAMLDQGVPRGLVVSALAILGMGTQVYEQKVKQAPAEKKKVAEEDRPLLPVMFRGDITPRGKVGLKR